MFHELPLYAQKTISPYVPKTHQLIWRSFNDGEPRLLPYLLNHEDPSIETSAFAEIDALVRDSYKIHKEYTLRVLQEISLIDPSWENYMLVKGMSFQRYYTDLLLRPFRDIDIITRTVEDLYQLVHRLSNAGFMIDAGAIHHPPWLPKSPHLYIEMVGDRPGAPYVELYAGGWQISFRTGITFDFLKQHSVSTSIGGITCRVPDNDTTMLILAAEQYERQEIRARDLFDLLLVTPLSNIERVTGLLKEYRLVPLMSRLANRLKTVVQDDTLLPQGVTQLAASYKSPKLPWVCHRTLVHVAPALFGLATDLVSAKAIIHNFLEESRCLLLKRQRHLWLVRTLTCLTRADSSLRHGRLVHLFYVDEDCSSWRVIRCKNGIILLRSPIGTFVLTVHMLEPDRRILDALIESSRKRFTQL
ncbi:MAG: nucleotidyltransferase family protein [Bacillota bacterium]|nr:nucleotidyltransferase family protein [Bacillota bacterium]